MWLKVFLQLNDIYRLHSSCRLNSSLSTDTSFYCQVCRRALIRPTVVIGCFDSSRFDTSLFCRGVNSFAYLGKNKEECQPQMISCSRANYTWGDQNLCIMLMLEVVSKRPVSVTLHLLFATLERRQELEPKCVPKLILGSLLRTCRSAIGQFFPSPGNSPRSLCESELGPLPFWFQKWRISITSMAIVLCNIKPFLLFQQIWTKAEWRYLGSWNAG